MATRLHAPQPLPLDALLATIPSLPRPVLARLTARLIDRIDEMDGDPDLEEGADREWIDEREPELFEGGDGDEAPRGYTRRAIPHHPRSDLSRVKRRLRAMGRPK